MKNRLGNYNKDYSIGSLFDYSNYTPFVSHKQDITLLDKGYI